MNPECLVTASGILNQRPYEVDPRPAPDRPAPLPTQSERPRWRVTSFDVAEAAGVSQSTVSRALGGHSGVGEATRERIIEAARQLNYFVNQNAARLRTGQSRAIAVVVLTEPPATRESSPYAYFALLGSICEAASSRGFETLVSFQTNEDNLFGRYEEQSRADGVIVIGSHQHAPAWRYFEGLAQNGARILCCQLGEQHRPNLGPEIAAAGQRLVNTILAP